MVAERKVIDIDNSPDLEALADELERHPAGVQLRRSGRTFGILTLSASPERVDRPDLMSPDEAEQFRSGAGAWVGIVDFDELATNREASRRLNLEHARQPVADWSEPST